MGGFDAYADDLAFVCCALPGAPYVIDSRKGQRWRTAYRQMINRKGIEMKRILSALLVCSASSALAQPAPQPNQWNRVPPVTALAGDAALLAQPCEGVLSMDKTYALARKWVDAWNSTSADAVMGLYTADFEFRARGIITHPVVGNPGGVLHGQADNRRRWFDPARNGVKAAGFFRLIDAYAGVRSIAVHYLTPRSEPVVEVMEYARDCKIERSNAMYGPMPIGDGTASGPQGRPATSAAK